VQVNQLAEALHEVLPTLSLNKSGITPKSVLYRVLLQRGLFVRSQLAPSTFYHGAQAPIAGDRIRPEAPAVLCHAVCQPAVAG